MRIFNASLSALGMLLGLSSSLHGAEDTALARTQWGQPDLQGVWNFSSDVPLQRPAHFGDRQFLTPKEITAEQEQRPLRIGSRSPIRSAEGVEALYNDNIWAENRSDANNVRTSLIVLPGNGRLPSVQAGINYQPGGERDVAGTRPVRFAVGGVGRTGPEDRGVSERCLVGFNNMPQLMPSVYNNNIQIIQNRDYVVILSEMVHDARMIPLRWDARLSDDIGLWSGDSRGRWEDSTLVIETRNFNGLTQSFAGYGSSKNKLLVERLTKVGPRSISYEYTITDLDTFSEPVSVILPLTKVDAQLYEYACHEGNYGMANMLKAARARDATAEMDRVADLFRDRQ